MRPGWQRAATKAEQYADALAQIPHHEQRCRDFPSEETAFWLAHWVAEEKRLRKYRKRSP